MKKTMHWARAAVTLLAVFCFLGAWAQITYTATDGTDGVKDKEGYATLFDGDTGTKWCVTSLGTPTFVEFKTSSAITPKGYALTTGGDTQSNPGRNPKNWVLKAKVNSTDETWTTLHTVENDNRMEKKNKNSTSYAFANSTAYQYFRLEISAVQSGSELQLSEFRFLSDSEVTELLKDLTLVSVEGLQSQYQRTGSAITISYTVKNLLGETIDPGNYTATFKNSSNTVVTDIIDNDTYTLAITPNGETYHGTKSATFEVVPWNLAALAGGYCGDPAVNGGKNVYYEITQDASSNKTVTIKGTGVMANYGYASGAPWYNYKSSIVNVVVEDGVTTIGKNAFYNYSELGTIIGCKDVTTISDYAFYGSGLTSITIPASVTSIGSGAFSNCTALATITVDGGNTNFKMIGGVLFSMDETLLVLYPAGKKDKTIYDIPNSVTSIGDEAFNGCTALTSITNLDNVTSIGDYAFQNCTGLTSFTIPVGITTLSEGLFYDCTNLTSINIPNTVTSIGYDAFYHTPWLNNLSYDDDGISYAGKIAVASNGASGAITIKPGTTAIASELFDGNDDITSVFIPASVKSIGDYAFYDCDYLQTITFEENSQLTSIGKYAFYETNLNTITIPAGVTAIGEGAFEYCYYLNKVTFENGSQLTAIGDDTFYYCYNMQDITIPAGVTSIGDYAFYYCYLMKDITIPAGVTAIGEGAFYDCYYLNKVTFENGSQLKTIGDYAFCYCNLMKDITIPASVTSIGADAFSGCSSMSDVYCEADPTQLSWNDADYNDFNYSNSDPYIQTMCHVENAADWSSFVWKVNVKFVGGYCGNTAANGGKNLHWDVVMNGSDYILKISKNPNAVGTDFSMADNVDFGGKDYNSITIENGVTNIGASAFAGFTNLTSVTIPASVTSIGASAFSGSTSLKSLLVLNETPSSLGSNAFKDIDNNAVFTVLNSNYLTSDGWKDVKNHAGDYNYDGCAFTMTVPDASYHNIAYIDANGQPAVCPMAFPITSSSDDVDLDYSGDTWYFVTGDVVIDKDLTFKNSAGSTNLILCDGASLTTSRLTANNSMNIYVQTNGTGALTINNAVDKANAFYVENDLVINGGNITVNATGDNGYGIFSKKGDITINKGTITSDVTFINIYASSYGRDLVINGGTINASTKEYGLYAYGDLIVNGGMVNVKMTSSDYEGLGAYYNLNINGGQVTVDSDGKGYGLYANYNDLTINGGTITVKNTKYGIDTYYGTIKINDGVITITDAEYGLYAYYNNIEINGGKISADGSSVGICADDYIYLNWSKIDDFITTTSFYGTVNILNKNFTDGTSIYNSTTPSATLGALTDVTLSPLAVLEDAADNTTALTSLYGKKIAVALNGRTLKAGHWNSVFLPFALDDAQIAASFGADAIVKTLDSYSNDGTNVTIGFTTVTTMEAGKPYIVFIPEDENIVNPIFMGATINPVSSSVTKGDAQFCGVYAPMNLGKSLYRLFLQNDKFYYPNETGATINAFRGYFALTNPVPEAASAKIIVDFGDEETTGIGAALNENGEMTNDVWYTLQGVKLDGKPSEKGIYIYNGKKVAVQ